MKTKLTLKQVAIMVCSFMLWIATTNSANAQVKIGDNETTIDPASLLELESTTKGLLLPRMTTAQMNAVANPPEGLTIFNTTDSCIFMRRSGAWASMCGGDHDFYPYTRANNTRTTDSPPLISDDLWTQGTVVWGGSDNVATGTNSAVFGVSDSVLANNSAVWGQNNTLRGDNSAIWGDGNTLTEANSLIFGLNNSSDALAGLVFGEENHVPNNVEYGLVGGYRNYVESRSLVDCNLVYGERDTVAGRGSMALGRSININAQRSVGIGGFIDIDHQGSFVFTDGRNGTLSSGGNHTMTMRFTGGYSLFTNNGLSTGVQLTPGSSAWSSISDRRAKNSIDPVYYGLNAVMKLKPSQYYYNGNDFKSLGFIAQEVKEVVPEVVVVPEDSTQMMSVRYTELIPVLTKAIQEQQAQIEALKAENAALKADASATASNLETKVNALMLLMEQNGISTTASK